MNWNFGEMILRALGEQDQTQQQEADRGSRELMHKEGLVAQAAQTDKQIAASKELEGQRALHEKATTQLRADLQRAAEQERYDRENPFMYTKQAWSEVPKEFREFMPHSLLAKSQVRTSEWRASMKIAVDMFHNKQLGNYYKTLAAQAKEQGAKWKNDAKMLDNITKSNARLDEVIKGVGIEAPLDENVGEGKMTFWDKGVATFKMGLGPPGQISAIGDFAGDAIANETAANNKQKNLDRWGKGVADGTYLKGLQGIRKELMTRLSSGIPLDEYAIGRLERASQPVMELAKEGKVGHKLFEAAKDLADMAYAANYYQNQKEAAALQNKLIDANTKLEIAKGK